jgi:nucleoside-diphosphate-sugar epimerase
LRPIAYIDIVSTRVLILGGTGFIGTSLTRELRRNGYIVQVQGRSAVADLRVDATDASAVVSMLRRERADVIIDLLAAGVTPGTPVNESGVALNLGFPSLLLEELSTWVEFPHLIHTGSSLTNAQGVRDEASEYGRTKGLASDLFRQAGQDGIGPLTLLVLHNVYGPNQPYGRLVADCIRTLSAGQPLSLRYPDRIRDFTFVEDLGEVVTRVMETPTDGFREVDVGTGIGTTVRDIAREIAASLKVSSSLVSAGSPSVDDPQPSVIAEVEPRRLGYCHTGTAEGIIRTIRFWA